MIEWASWLLFAPLCTHALSAHVKKILPHHGLRPPKICYLLSASAHTPSRIGIHSNSSSTCKRAARQTSAKHTPRPGDHARQARTARRVC